MSFSDILALLEILVTILFGYYITHWVSVRDTRTRSVKDLYLNQLSDIKKRVDTFFDDLFAGKLKGRTIADWYGNQQNSLTCFDEGLRLALPIRKVKLEDIVNEIHETITGSDYYNDHFSKRKYELTNEERAKMLALKNKVDRSFNEYVVQINNSRQYYFWETLKQSYQFDLEYFKSTETKWPKWSVIRIRCVKILPYLLAVLVLFFVIKGTYNSYKVNFNQEQSRQETLERDVDKLIERVDSVNESLKSIAGEIETVSEQDSVLIQAIRLNANKERQIIREIQEIMREK